MKIIILKIRMYLLNRKIDKTQSILDIDTYELCKEYNSMVSNLNRLKNAKYMKAYHKKHPVINNWF